MQTLAKGLAKARLRSVSPNAGADAIEAPLMVDADEDLGLDIEALPSIEPDPRIAADNRIVFDEQTQASSAYKMLRTRILQRMRSNRWQTIAVTGTCPSEGKSLTAVNLSISLA